MHDQDLASFSADSSAKLLDLAIARRRHQLDQAFALIHESRGDFLQRLEKSVAEIAEAGEARAMLEERIRRMLERTEALRDGKTDRNGAALAQAKDLAELDIPDLKQVIARVIDAAGGVPRPPAEAMGLMAGRKAPEAWLERTGIFGTIGFAALPDQTDEEDETGTIRQGLDDDPVPMVPPPLGVCLSAPYADVASALSLQAISNGFIMPSAANGSVFTFVNAGVGALVPGFGSARGTVIADFVLPPGYTNVTITADVAFTVRLSAWAVLAATWSVADLLVTAEHSDGSFAERSAWVGSQVAPGIWGGTQTITATRRVILSRMVPVGGGSLRVGAGSHSYANAPTGLAGIADSSINATVRSLCLTAT